MTQPALVAELTASGAKDVEHYSPGQRLILPEQTARWMAAHGWVVLLDDDTEEVEHADR